MKKILYAVQGTGNGHISRAREIVPVLSRLAQCDVLISGDSNETISDFRIKYHIHGLGFVFGKNGGIDILGTLQKANLHRLISEVRRVPVENYDLVINDFEPVTAWACQLKKIPCVGLSHQASLLSGKVPVPENPGIFGPWIIRNYAPADRYYGFHFAPYDTHIFTPVIRSEIRKVKTKDAGHYTVYLPAWDELKIMDFLRQFRGVRWHIFSKHSPVSWQKGNFSVFPVSAKAFTESMASSTGVLCGAGFETPAEALYLKKKLMVIPMKGQYEQQSNAEALSRMGVPVIKDLSLEFAGIIGQWLASDKKTEVRYPDQTEQIISRILEYSRKNNFRVHPVSVWPDWQYRKSLEQV